MFGTTFSFFVAHATLINTNMYKGIFRIVF
jgi:hypothetical protein